ncbi:sigma factor regulatory protein, FecR/PupR family [Leptospira broomii serovar Hurstbridge str. 5399]|uniref:Sigma factor regulatory protein, FecR/PupR family n=1 Tax=Leptospira broomii serovar Hurstbridge str. 5399 TaxID=1049789 RepID=T0GD84_9LEPT|nr:FecR domain-containing protein [Leptospira broomii]EQA43378.1 sigma factor regulatory protein, FecR/PupR family [Leptospira broomii serovar Hurstbridge str. 5399]
MRFLTDAKFVVTGLILLIIFFSSLLYMYANAGPKTGNNKIVGELKSKQLKILRKLDSEVVWEELDPSDPIRFRDTIRTEEGSVAVLLFKDGNNSTEIQMGERSMILIEDTDKISFVSGSLSATNSGDASKLQISSGDTKISLANSNVKLSKDEGKALNLEVKEGQAKVVSSSGESVLNGNQAAELKGNTLEVRTLKLEQIAPADGATVPVKGETSTLRFAWKPEAGVKNYYLEIAKDPSFRIGLKRIPSTGSEVSVNVSVGNYFWKVVGKNPKTGKDESSLARNLRVLSWNSPRLLSPAAKETFTFTTGLPVIRFQWSVMDPTAKYTLEIAEDSGFKQIALRSESKSGFAKWESKSEGNFFARVRMYSDREGFSEEVSAAIPFSVRKLAEAEPPRLHRPLSEEEIGLRIFKTGNSFFSWSANREFQSYTLEISNESEFKNILLSRTVSANFLKPEFDWKEGVYFWKVRGNLKDGGKRDSLPQKFVLKHIDFVKLSSPKDGTESGHPSDGKIILRWDRPDPSGLYRVELARDASFETKLSDSKVRSGALSVTLPSPGSFYWRVSLVTPSGETLVSSSVANFRTTDSAPFVTPVYPRDRDKIDLDEKESLSFYWETQGTPEIYVLELLESQGKNWKPILKKEIRGETFEFRELYKLREGKYQWRLSAKYKDDAGKIRTTIPLSREFNVLLSATLKAPEVLTPKEIYVE